jgi:ABC-type uncharacterized transport system auxiliary subunit
MSRLTERRRFIAIVATLALLAACSLPGPSKQTEKQFFVLQDHGVSSPVPNPDAKPCFSLRITMPDSAAGLNTARMTYSTEPNRLDYFAYHEWIAPPAKMLATLMESHLQASGLFSAVLVGSADVRTDLRLDSEVRVFQQDFTKDDGTLNVTIRGNLVEVQSRSLLGSETFVYHEPAVGNAEAGVVAANRAVNRYLDELTGFLDVSIRNLECPDQEQVTAR